MKEHFSEQLETLRQQLIILGAESESQIRLAVEALITADAEKANAVIAHDSVIDQMELRNEEFAIHLLALQQPVAVDLRFLVSALKINNDLERIGDHAVNIAESAVRLSAMRPFKPWIDIPHMAEVARTMLKKSLDSFVRRDTAMAIEVCKEDDILDQKHRSIIRELLTYMAEHHSLISSCIEIMNVSKNLERVGDLATNIAEESIFIVEGRTIKHHNDLREASR
ncbi:MAG: phosphate signaling complex protein PhoU [Acidobacteria bacterium]|nr:phosphate signaling complex protein PhoU [Acidobacteriota bacterium]